MSENLIHQKGLYQKHLVQRIIQIPFIKMTNNVEQIFIDYANENIMNQCEKEGYISDHSCKVISYSGGKITSSDIYYNVVFEFMICYPFEGMTFDCKVQSITKIGIKAVLSNDDIKNPFTIFASYLHNPSIFQNTNTMSNDENTKYKINDIIKVRVLGHRFEINDSTIHVLVEIIE